MEKRQAISLLALAFAAAQTVASQPTLRLTLELTDYAPMPITGELDGQNTRGQLARVNFLRDEPGSRRFFVNDLNGPLYIVDKQTKTFATFLDFNGAGGRPGLFPKFTFERNLAIGLTNFQFDPDYAHNGVFYTIHMEDPAVAAAAAPRAGVVAGLDLSGYTTTPPIATPTVAGRIDREAVLIEWKDRNTANTTFEGTARELMRLQQPLAIHPMGEMTFNPVARRGDPDWRVMYIGSGDAGSGEQRDSRRLNPQRLDTLVGKILRIVPDLREHTATSTVSENGAVPDPQGQSLLGTRGRAKGDLGVRLAQSASDDLGRRSGAAQSAVSLRVQHRALRVGDGGHCPEGRELRLFAARRSADDVPRRDGRRTGERHGSDTDFRYGRTRHGQAHVPRHSVPARDGKRRRCHRRRVHLPRQQGPCTSRQALIRGHHDGPDSGTPSSPTCSQPTTATRRQWRRFTR